MIEQRFYQNMQLKTDRMFFEFRWLAQGSCIVLKRYVAFDHKLKRPVCSREISECCIGYHSEPSVDRAGDLQYVMSCLAKTESTAL